MLGLCVRVFILMTQSTITNFRFASLKYLAVLFLVAVTISLRLLGYVKGDIAMYFLRVDYVYRGGPVQRIRRLCSNLRIVLRELSEFRYDDFMLLQVKVERCV